MDEIPPQVPGYRPTRLLGTGATSQVWRARRTSDDELVAVKVLPGEADEAAVREFALLQQAAGEHVVTLHETLALEGSDGPATALVLELLSGGSLAQVVAARGHLTPGETVTVIAPIAQALGGLHDLGIVHGDLSPGNVLLDSTGRPSLGDLGFSRLTGESPGELHGTDGYVAPEVLEGGEPDRAGDVHALGALAWLCLTGAAPGHVAERAELQTLVPGAPELVEVVRSCLAGDPTARPEADEVARAVFDAVPAEPIRMTTPGDVASGLTRRIRESAAEGVLEVPEWQRELTAPAPPTPRRRWWHRRDRAKGAFRPRAGARQRAGRHGAARRGLMSGPRRPTERAGPKAAPAAPAAPLSPLRSIARAAVERPATGRTSILGVVALALLLAVLVPWRLAGAGETRGSSEVGVAEEGRSAGSPSPVADGAGTDEASVRTDRAAPRTAPIRLARELTALREQMVAGLDLAALERLVEPGSPAAERDRALIEQLTTAGVRYRGVDLGVRTARLQRQEGRVAVLRTTSDAGAYVVVAGDGGRERRPASPGRQVDLVLVWHDDAWRVRDVR